MRQKFTGVPGFDPSSRFQRGGRSGQSPPANSAAAGGLPQAPPASSAPPTGAPSASPASGSVDLSKLIQNLEKLNIASEPTHPKVTTLAEALRKHFGDQAKIDVNGQTIKVTTPQGVRQLEVYTRSYKGKKRAYLRLRVDERTTRPIGQLLRYGNEYYINADLLRNIDKTPRQTQKRDDSQKPEPKRKLPKSVLYGAGVLAAGGAAVGLSRFLGGGDDDDDEKKAQSDSSGGIEEVVQLNPEQGAPPATAFVPTAPTSAPTTTSDGRAVQKVDPPRVTVTEQPKTPNVVVSVPAPQVIREITSGEAPVQTQRKGNETIVKAGTSDGVFTLNIGADKTLILRNNEVVGEFPTAEIIRAVGQIKDGRTEKEMKRSGEFDDLLKNPWFFVAIALALIAFTRRNKRE
jgi:hypothetical protein